MATNHTEPADEWTATPTPADATVPRAVIAVQWACPGDMVDVTLLDEDRNPGDTVRVVVTGVRRSDDMVMVTGETADGRDVSTTASVCDGTCNTPYLRGDGWDEPAPIGYVEYVEM